MNLAFCIFKYYPFGGLERNFLRVTEECLNRGFSVDVYTMSWEGEVPEKFKQNEKFKIIKVPFNGLSNHSRCYSYTRNLVKPLQNEKYDLITGFNRMPGLDLYYCADVCFKADVHKRHSFLYKLTPRYRIYSSLEHAVFSPESSTEILILSDIQRKIYQQEYSTPENRFHPIPPGIDKERIRSFFSDDKRKAIREELNLQDSEIMLLMIGSDFRRKGVMRSIKAVASLPENQKKKVKLFVIGKGKPEKYQKIASSSGINIIFPGTVNDVEKYLSASDMLLHPAVSENTGNAIVEALISGTPVLATSNCGYAFHVQNANAGIVVDGDSFSQSKLNTALNEMLKKIENNEVEWKKKAIAYTDKTDLYSRPKAIANTIEECIREKKS